jgi:hypothetical protein
LLREGWLALPNTKPPAHPGAHQTIGMKSALPARKILPTGHPDRVGASG